MPKDERYFIWLPASPAKGIKGGFYPVDPALLRISILTEIYKRGPRGRYDRAYGVEPDLTNPADLLQHWRALREQIRQTLPDSGLAGVFAQELLSTLSGLPRLIEALARGQLTDADSVIGTLGDELTALAGMFVETITELETRAPEQDEQVGLAGDVREELYAATAESLADSIDEGLTAYNGLRAMEAELDAVIQALVQTHQWADYVAGGPEWLPAQLAWLGEEDGFCLLASRFLIKRDPSLINYMVAVISGNGGVRDRLQAIEARLTEARVRHASLRGRADAALEQQFRIDSLIRTMQASRDDVARLSRSGINPFELVKGLITADEFETWQMLLTDADWQSLLAVTHRLRDKTQSVHQLVVQEPALAPADDKVIGRVEHYVSLVESMLTELGQPTVQAPVPSPTTASTVTKATIPSRKREPALPPGVDPVRRDELYEIMLVIGAVKYCDHFNLTGGTPKAMFDLLEALGLMTSEERQIYNGELRRKLSDDSFEVEGSGLTRKQAWEQTDPRNFRWIQFKQRRGRNTKLYSHWRLVEQYKDAARALCAKYGLDPSDIEAAYDARRAARSPKQQ